MKSRIIKKDNNTESGEKKPWCSWTEDERYSDVELNMSINYEERFIIARALSLLYDACDSLRQFERSNDVRHLKDRFASEYWERVKQQTKENP